MNKKKLGFMAVVLVMEYGKNILNKESHQDRTLSLGQVILQN